MLLIDEVIAYCDKKYFLRGSCEHCTHIGKCSGGCKYCLQEIHFPKENPCDKKEYDCDNLINFYVCDYSYKYASEIWYLLRQSKTINSMENYNILSIGCGGCPDLMAFESYVEECGGNKTISYTGIDKNELWKPIHHQIEIYQNHIIRNVEFNYDDAIDYFEKYLVNDINVLILQYVISYFYNTDQIKKIDEFFYNLVDSLLIQGKQKGDFVIIINDVNSCYRGREYFSNIVKNLSAKGFNGMVIPYYFPYNIKNEHQKYGIEHCSTDLLYGEIPEKLYKYEPPTHCSSAQLLIEVNKLSGNMSSS